MKEIIFALLLIVIALLIGWVVKRFDIRGSRMPVATLRGRVLVLASMSLGIIIGFFALPHQMLPVNEYIRLFVAILTTLLLGAVEVYAISSLSYKWLNDYTLDGRVFPFMSLGISVALFLKPIVLT